MNFIKKHSKFIWPIVFGISFVVVWYSAILAFSIEEFLLPSPHAILQASYKESSTLFSGARETLFACVIGFTISLIGGFGLSLLLTSAKWIYEGLYPWILIIKMMPIIAIAPIIIIWFGHGLNSIMVITFLICFFPIVANTTMGLLSTDRNLLDLFRVSNASKVQEMLYLRIPYAMPYFLTGLKIAAALTPIGALYGETLAGSGTGSKGGLGFLVVIYSQQIKVPALFSSAFSACLVGFIFVGLVNTLHWFLLHKWHDSFVKSE